LDKNEVRADIERWCFLGQSHRVIESLAVCHQRGGRKHALTMRINNARVHVSGETEIVSVNNQTPQFKKCGA
jgi:hypothetical protein